MDWIASGGFERCKSEDPKHIYRTRSRSHRVIKKRVEKREAKCIATSYPQKEQEIHIRGEQARSGKEIHRNIPTLAT